MVFDVCRKKIDRCPSLDANFRCDVTALCQTGLVVNQITSNPSTGSLSAIEGLSRHEVILHKFLLCLFDRGIVHTPLAR